MFRTIWERYFLIETLKVFFLILFSFFGLYFLIDYSIRSGGQLYTQSQFELHRLLYYYVFVTIERIEVLIPFALMIATIRTLTKLNVQNELIALMISGLNIKTLLRPFVFLALFATACLYLNLQYTIPKVAEKARHMTHSLQLKNRKKEKKFRVENVQLKDHTTLLFQRYDEEEKTFFDVFWIKSFDEIYHMKSLSAKEMPIGRQVDHLKRLSSQKMQKIASTPVQVFPEIQFNRQLLLDALTPTDARSLTALWKSFPKNGRAKSEKQAQLMTTLYKKMIIPWLCVFAVLAPASQCVKFSRHFPVFFIYSFFLFLLTAFYIVIDAAVVLGSRQVVDPLYALGFPFLLMIGGSLFSFFKVR